MKKIIIVALAPTVLLSLWFVIVGSIFEKASLGEILYALGSKSFWAWNMLITLIVLLGFLLVNGILAILVRQNKEVLHKILREMVYTGCMIVVAVFVYVIVYMSGVRKYESEPYQYVTAPPAVGI